MTNHVDCDHLRKFAAHRIHLDGNVFSMFLVEVLKGKVVDYRKLVGEEAKTEWLGGDIELQEDEEGLLTAFHDGKKLE